MKSTVRVLLAIVASLAILYLRMAYKVLAQFFDISQATLQSWKQSSQDQWFRRFLVSCQPIKMKIGSLYYVDRGMVLTLLAIIVDSTVSLLLTHEYSS